MRSTTTRRRRSSPAGASPRGRPPDAGCAFWTSAGYAGERTRAQVEADYVADEIAGMLERGELGRGGGRPAEDPPVGRLHPAALPLRTGADLSGGAAKEGRARLGGAEERLSHLEGGGAGRRAAAGDRQPPARRRPRGGDDVRPLRLHRRRDGGISALPTGARPSTRRCRGAPGRGTRTAWNSAGRSRGCGGSRRARPPSAVIRRVYDECGCLAKVAGDADGRFPPREPAAAACSTPATTTRAATGGFRGFVGFVDRLIERGGDFARRGELCRSRRTSCGS